jgi:hypothetical protein
MAIRQQAWREKTYVGVDKAIADGSKLKNSKTAKKLKKAAKR